MFSATLCDAALFDAGTSYICSRGDAETRRTNIQCPLRTLCEPKLIRAETAKIAEFLRVSASPRGHLMAPNGAGVWS